LEIPEKHALAQVCGVAWHWIVARSDCIPPRLFEERFYTLKSLYLKYSRDDFHKDFNGYWRGLRDERLWDTLFSKCCIRKCSTVLVSHPVEESSILGSWEWSDVFPPSS
jgi:hypothetical protein